MQETQVRFLGQEDPLEEGMATHSSTLAWRLSPGQKSLVGYSLWGCKESDTTERLPFPFPNTSNHMLLQFHVLVSIHPET